MSRHFVHLGIPAFLVAFCATTATAQDWDTFPSLPAEGNLGIAGDLDNPSWEKTRTCLSTLESKVDATYYAVVVNVSDARGDATPAANDAVPYVDAVYQYWKPGGRVAADKHILIALGLKNRAVAIHAGTDWTDLGFRRGTITQAIDGSAFKKHARNGDYPESVCALARAVDTKLGRMVAQRRKWLADARAQADGRLAALPALEREIRAATRSRPKARDVFLAELDVIRDTAHGAREQADAGRADLARSGAQRADELDALLRRKLTQIPKIEAAVADLRDEIANHREALKGRSDLEWDGPIAAAKTLDRCETLATSAEASVDAGTPLQVPLPVVNSCAASVESTLASADVRYTLYTRVIPIGTLLFALLLMAIFLFIMRRRRTMFVEQLDERLRHWDTWLGHAAERVLEMETRHPLYFGAGSLRYEGETEPLDTEAAEAVNHVFLLLDRAQELARQARALRGAGGPLSSEPVLGALELLSTETVRIETGDKEARRRIFLPLQEAYEGSANELLEHLDAMYGRAMEKLDVLHRAVDGAEALVSEIATTHDMAELACTRREEMGLSAGLLRHALVEAAQGLDEAEDTAPLDPVAASGPLGEILGRMRDVAGRATAGNDVMGQLRGPVRELGKSLRATVARLRKAGFRMDEPGLAPEARLNDRADDAHRIAPLLDDGDLQGARTLLDTIATDLQYLSEQLSTTEAAREGVPNAVARAMTSRDRLQARVPNAREILDTLTSDHDPVTFADESDNLEELADMLGGLEKWRRKVTAAHAAQRYMEACREIRGCEAFLTRGQALLDAIDHVQSRLNGAREHAKAAWHGIGELREAVEAGLGRSDARPGAPGRSRHQELTSQTDPIGGAIERPKPNWPELSQTLDALHEEWEVLERRLGGWRRDYVKARQTVSTVRTQLAELQRRVTAERRDRPHVAAAVDTALTDLAQWDEAVANESLTGSELLDTAGAYQQRATWAVAVWNREVKAIHDAQTEAAAALRRFRSLERTSFGWGVTARTSDLDRLVRQMDEQQRAARYEDIVHTARRIREGSAKERKRCERKVRQKRDAQRRRDAAARAAAAAAARRASSSSFSSSSSSSFSSSSYSSSTSGGSSFSSSSGGGSFGSSNSGGSSW